MNYKKFFLLFFLIFLTGTIYARDFSTKEAAQAREAIVADAKKYIGCPYKTGAIGPDEFDCSGLVFTVFRESASIQLPRSVKAIYSTVKIVANNLIEEGDLVFFKTTGDGTISHVGIYIGRNQFIHAASDGSNTGVIVSSLTEKYYQNCFAAVGKPLASGSTEIQKAINVQKNESKKEDKKTETKTSSEKKDDDFSESEVNDLKKKARKTSSKEKKQKEKSSAPNFNFARDMTIDTTISGDWNLWLPSGFAPNFRGISFNSFARYNVWKVQPALGFGLRWNYGCECFQIPVMFSIYLNDYINIYAGVNFTIGNPKYPGTSTALIGSIIPGVFGVTFNTPPVKLGKILVSLSQDFAYTVFNDTEGRGLRLGETLAAGLVFSSGIRVTLPLSNVLK